MIKLFNTYTLNVILDRERISSFNGIVGVAIDIALPNL